MSHSIESFDGSADESIESRARVTRMERISNRRAAWFWGSLVVAFLGGQIAIGVVAIVLATNDPSFAVVPDYHHKAIHWDESVRVQTSSDHLGWTSTIVASPAADALGQRAVVVTLSDREGKPITDAVVSVRVFHHARAGAPVESTLRASGDGHYSGLVDMRRGGLWQFDVTATRGRDERFLHTQTIDTDESRVADGSHSISNGDGA